MNHINIYAVGGDTVVLSGGVFGEEIAQSAAEIIKNEPLHVQAGFIVSTEIKIPRIVCATDFFSADCALCFGAYLHEIKDNGNTFFISSTGADTPLSICIEEDKKTGTLSFAGKAKLIQNEAGASVVFGGCEYFIIENFVPENPQELLTSLCEHSSCASTALLLKSGDTVTPHYRQKEACVCGFSAGSAALALAFYDSESNRDYFQAVYRFPKGERKVEMKRFLSEAFDAKLTANIEKRG